MAKATEPRIDASRESSSEDKVMKKEKEHKFLKGGLQLRSGSTMPASLRVGWHRETSRAGHGHRSDRDGGVMWSTTSVFGREWAPGNKLKAASPLWVRGESGGQNERERLIGRSRRRRRRRGRALLLLLVIEWLLGAFQGIQPYVFQLPFHNQFEPRSSGVSCWYTKKQ